MTIMTRSGARFWWKEELPKNVIYLYKEIGEENWREYTYSERNAERKEKQEFRISEKRYHFIRVPCYIHVFNINSDFLFAGFYITIWSKYGTWYLNWRTDWKHEKFFPRIKNALPLGLLDIADDKAWFTEFCKAYPMKAKGIQKPRGNYLTHCIIDSYGKLIDIELSGEYK